MISKPYSRTTSETPRRRRMSSSRPFLHRVADARADLDLALHELGGDLLAEPPPPHFCIMSGGASWMRSRVSGSTTRYSSSMPMVNGRSG